jgi:hypothetical protein
MTGEFQILVVFFSPYHCTSVVSYVASPVMDPQSEPSRLSSQDMICIASIRAHNLAAMFALCAVKQSSPPDTYSSSHLVEGRDDDGKATIEYRILIGKHAPAKWSIGAGPEPSSDRSGPDIILLPDGTPYIESPDFLVCPPVGHPASETVHESVGGMHAEFFIHPLSNVLMIRSTSHLPTVLYKDSVESTAANTAGRVARDGAVDDGTINHAAQNTRPGVEVRMTFGREHAFTAERTLVKIGPYEFDVAYTSPDTMPPSKTWKKIRERYIDSQGGYVATRLDFLPQPHHTFNRNFCVHRLLEQPSRPLAHLGVGDGHSAVDRTTGRPVLIRARRHDCRTLAWVRNELHAGDPSWAYKNLDTGIAAPIAIWCRHSQPPCYTNKRPDQCCVPETVWYAIPLPQFSFVSMPWARVKDPARLMYFHQTLLGLCAMHAKPLIHRDIQPSNLLVFAVNRTLARNRGKNRLQAAISPTVHAYPGDVCTRVHDAPNRWMAPEMHLFPQGSQSLPPSPPSRTRPYARSVDVYSLARCWLDTFDGEEMARVFPTNVESLRESHERARDVLGRLAQRQGARGEDLLLPLFELMGQMLARDPKARPAASRALAHRAWRVLFVL